MGEMAVKGSMTPEELRTQIRGEMRIMGRAGDTRLIWDPANEHEVENAKRTFDDLRKKRFLAFKVGSGGKKGEQVTEFDEHAEKLILAPPMAGGG